MENAPSVVNHLVKSPAGKSEAEKGGRIIQKGNNSAKAVFIESQDGDHIGKNYNRTGPHHVHTIGHGRKCLTSTAFWNVLRYPSEYAFS